ncbi:hypothetical protein CIB84_016949, partial [Bambusicola thoracicus]
MGTPSELRML